MSLALGKVEEAITDAVEERRGKQLEMGAFLLQALCF